MGHAHWWDFVAPALAEDYRVLAMDLSGMGDSAYRSEYSMEKHAAEIAGIIRHSGNAPAFLIGHSFGGRCSILTAHAYPQLVKRLIVVDSRVSFPDPNRKRIFDRDPSRAKKRHADLASAKARFKLMPDEAGTPPRIFDHIAGHSLKKEGDGWVWKFDQALGQRGPKPAITDAEALPLLQMPVDFVCGQFSQVVQSQHAKQIADAISVGRAPIVIPSGFHHLPIGQPLALTSVLRALLFS
jgi:pimeloyl-ACP methyl ester carboxylesterase